jgi:hypothetical protein
MVTGAIHRCIALFMNTVGYTRLLVHGRRLLPTHFARENHDDVMWIVFVHDDVMWIVFVHDDVMWIVFVQGPGTYGH